MEYHLIEGEIQETCLVFIPMLIERSILCTKVIKPKFNWKLVSISNQQDSGKEKENLFSYKNLSWTMTLNERQFGWILEPRNKWSAIDANSLFQSGVAIYKLNKLTHRFVNASHSED